MRIRNICAIVGCLTCLSAHAQHQIVPTALSPVSRQDVMDAFWAKVDQNQRERLVPHDQSRTSKAILDCLSYSKSNLGYFLLSKGGSITFLTVGAFSKNQQFAVLSTWILAMPVEVGGTTYFVGVSTSVMAVCQSNEKSIRINGLFGVAAGVEQRRVQGSLEVVTQGLAGKAVTDNTKTFQQISEDTLFSVTENVAVIKSKLYDSEEMTVQPAIVGVQPSPSLFEPVANQALLSDLKLFGDVAMKIDYARIKGMTGG